MAVPTKYPENGAKRNGPEKNWGRPSGGTDYLLARPGRYFTPAVNQDTGQHVKRRDGPDNLTIQQRNQPPSKNGNRRASRPACGGRVSRNSRGLSKAIQCGLICAHETARDSVGLQGLRGQPKQPSPCDVVYQRYNGEQRPNPTILAKQTR